MYKHGREHARGRREIMEKARNEVIPHIHTTPHRNKHHTL